MAVTTIRPWKVFNLLDSTPDSRIASLFMPHRDSVMLSLETLIIATLVKYINPKRCFEFGTFRGDTTLTLAANLPVGGKVYTLDLPTDDLDEVSFDPFDKQMAQTATAEIPKFIGSSFENRIKRILMDSMKFEVISPFLDIDFVLVDGNHALPYVERDSSNAFKMLASSGCVVWHDYGELAVEMAERSGADKQNYIDITNFVNKLSEENPVWHVEDTRLAFSTTRDIFPE